MLKHISFGDEDEGGVTRCTRATQTDEIAPELLALQKSIFKKNAEIEELKLKLESSEQLNSDMQKVVHLALRKLFPGIIRESE